MSTMKTNKKVKRSLPYSKKTEENTATLTDPNTNEQYTINLDELLETPVTDSLASLIKDAGIDTLPSEEEFENYVEPPENLDAPTFLVNRKLVPLTLSSLTTNSKSLILGVDIITNRICAYFADHVGSNDHKLRVSLDELLIIIKDDIFFKISNMFSDFPTKFNVGGIEISLYKAKHGGKSIMLQRIGDPFSNFFFALTSWRKFGEARALIKMHIDTLSQSKTYIAHFLNQFVNEASQEIAKSTQYTELVKMDEAVQIQHMREAMSNTSSHIVNIYAQDFNLMSSCDVPSLREELIIYHFSFMKEKIFEKLKE